MVYDYLLCARDKPINKKEHRKCYTAVVMTQVVFVIVIQIKNVMRLLLKRLNNQIETHSIYQGICENSTRAKMELMGIFLSTVRYELEGTFA